MASLPINANICELDGAYYPVRLEWVPRVGELIDLFSYIEQADGRPSGRHYEVIRVIHKLRDIADKVPASHDGCHFVEVHVKAADPSLFRQ